MALRNGDRGWALAHLSFLMIFLLLAAGEVRGMAVESGGGGGGGGGEESGSGLGSGGGREGGVMEDRMDVEGGVVVVENGTVEDVVLDCPYHLDERDLKGLHLTWSHPRIRRPIYQWIPDSEPSALKIMEDRMDLTYEASTDAFHRYRAIRLLHPTTELSGLYRCKVSTFSVDFFYTQDLIVFREPSAVEVWVERRDEGHVAVFCKVEEVYPQPVLSLYQKSSSQDSEMLKGGTPITNFVGQTYNMKVENVVEEATLDGPTEFQCHVTIPKTEVQVIRTTKYQPMTNNSSTQQASAVLPVVLSVLVCLLHD